MKKSSGGGRMASMSNLNDQQNMAFTQLSYASNELGEHINKSFSRIREELSQKSDLNEEEKKLLNVLKELGSEFDNYMIKGVGNDAESGFGAVAFTDPDGNTGIAYRGTDMTSLVDWTDNAMATVTGESTQIDQAKDFFEEYKDPHGDNYLYGHSKGGNLSQEVFVENIDDIKCIHTLNAQPINPLELTEEQRQAMRSEKADMVIVEGDVVWGLGIVGYYDNIRVAKCKDDKRWGFDPHSYSAVTFQDGNIVEGNVLESNKINLGFLSLLNHGFSVAQLMWVVGNTMIYSWDEAWQQLNEFIAETERWISETIEAVQETIEAFRMYVNEVVKGVKKWVNETLNRGYREAIESPEIRVNTAMLRNYASRLRKVNQKIVQIDLSMDRLYNRMGFLDLFNVMNLLRADMESGYNWKLHCCINYLENTADDFENVERELAAK